MKAWTEPKEQKGTTKHEWKEEKEQSEQQCVLPSQSITIVVPFVLLVHSFLVLFSFSSFHALSFVNEEKEHNTSHSLKIKWCFVLCSSCFFAYLQMKCVK